MSKKIGHIFLPLLFFALPFWAVAQKHIKKETFYDQQKLIVRESYFVLKNNPEIGDSLYISYYQNAKIKSTGNLYKSKPQGEWNYFYENGNLKMTGPLENGLNSGYWKYYYETGVLSQEGKIYKEIKEGDWIYYFENGTIKNRGVYKKNKKQGIWVYYTEDGKLKANAIFDNDKGRYTEIYPDGKVASEGDIVDGKSNGEWKYYYPDGTLKAIGNEKDGQKEGLWKFYHPNGKISGEGNYINGKQEGIWKYYYDNGIISSEGNLSEGNKDGYWKLYYPSGNFKGEGKFDKGEGDYKEFYENGKLKTEGKIVNEKNEGLWKYYYESGAIEGQCYYNQGSGKYNGYYEDGSLKMEGLIENGNKTGIWKLYNEKGQLAGYYKTFYEYDVPVMRMVEPEDTSSVKKDTISTTFKPELKKKRKKLRYFTEKVNEFRGFILSIGPLGVIVGQIPIYLEYYYQERLGYEINFTYQRNPLFLANEKINPFNSYKDGFYGHIRQKFYHRDTDKGMFYFMHEIRYTRNTYTLKVIDSAMSLAPYEIDKTENTIEYSIMIGDRFMKEQKKNRFTVDGFVGVGIGYRFMNNNYSGNETFEPYFKNTPANSGVSFAFRLGINVGYIFLRRI